MQWRLIASQQSLLDALSESVGDAVAVDTEFMRRRTFYPHVALLQLCFEREALLVDPLALDDPQPIRDLFENQSVVKVMHSASEDFEVFDHWLGVQPRPLFDTQRAEALLGGRFGLGYGALVEAYRSSTVDKSQSRSDWLARPLSEEQCHYAAEDVAHLLPVYREQSERARASGKGQWVLEDGDLLAGASGASDMAYARRVKGAAHLDRRQWAVLDELCRWREEEAARIDRPRGWLMSDTVCLTLAQRQPRHRAALAEVEDLPPALLRRRGDQLLACIERASSMPADALPPPMPPVLSRAQREKMKTLRARGAEIAEELGVAPEILLGSRDYEALIREHAGQRFAQPPLWRGWRRELALEPLRAVLRRGS